MSEGLFNQLDEPPTIPMTCLGMTLDGAWDDGAIPVEAFVIVKTIHEGDFSYQLLSTRELNTIECLGMLRYGTIILEASILNRTESPEGEE